MGNNSFNSETNLDDEYSSKLIELARMVESIALHYSRKLRTMFWFGVLSAVWLTYYFVHTFDISLLPGVLLVAFFGLPPVEIWKLYSVLRETIGLPQKIIGIIGKIKGKVVEFRQDPEKLQQLQTAVAQKKLVDLWRMRKLIFQIRSLCSKSSELWAILADSLFLLFNPIFVTMMTVAIASTMLLFLAAVITVLFYIL